MKGLQLLLVEDEDDHAFLLNKALDTLQSRRRIGVTRVPDGLALLEYLESANPVPDLILLDLSLPRLDGFAVLKRLRQKPVLSAVPVAVVTASERPSDIRKARQLGAHAYLTKPVAPLELARALDGVGESQADPTTP